MLKEKLVIYVDMDGVLADFNNEPRAIERFDNEVGFFYNLQPIVKNVDYVNKLIANGFNVCILSASPNEQADFDKLVWLHTYLPKVKDITIMRVGQNKADFAKPNCINLLFDDYGKNCRDFINRGYSACKVDSENTIEKLFKGLFNL
jgi:5'(3')-deoxyribonucleotidase